jgi:hypothetical protein
MSLLVKTLVIELDTTEEKQQPLRVEPIANITEASLPVWVMFDAKVTGGTLPYCMSIWNRDNYFYGVGCVQGYIVEILSSPVRTLSLLPPKITQVREHTTIYNPLSMNDHLKRSITTTTRIRRRRTAILGGGGVRLTTQPPPPNDNG